MLDAVPWYMLFCLALVGMVAFVMLAEGLTRLWRWARGR